MWRTNWKINADKWLQQSDIQKSTDKARELREHDFIIGLNKETWSMLDDAQKRCVICYQLDRIAVKLDKNDDPCEDDRSRTVYRLRNDNSFEIEPQMQYRFHTTMKATIEHIVGRLDSAAEDSSDVSTEISNARPEAAGSQTEDEGVGGAEENGEGDDSEDKGSVEFEPEDGELAPVTDEVEFEPEDDDPFG
jgi:hypothetical protein